VDAENGRAYPDYLVRYYRGKRDPKRTPNMCKREAMKRSSSQRKAKPEVAVDEMYFDAMETGLVGGVSAILPVHFTWEYLGNSGWAQFHLSNDSILENAYQAFVDDNSMPSTVLLQTDEWAYEVDVKQMVQTNMEHADRRTRSVRRVVS
jgi:hypothetical protein